MAADDTAEGDTGQPDKRRDPPTIELGQSEYSSTHTQDAEAAADEMPPEQGAHSERDAARAWWGTAAIAAGAGIATSLIVLVLAWAGGLLTPQPMAPDTDSAARLARVEQRVGDIEGAPKPAADPVLPARVSALEQSAQTSRDALGNLRRQVDALSSALVELKSSGERTPPTRESGAAAPGASAEDIAALRGQIENAQRAIADLRDTLSAASARTPPAPDVIADERLRRFAFAILLDAAARRGEPYARELADYKSADVAAPVLSAADIDALEQFAASGLPPDRAMIDALMRDVNASMPPPASAASDKSGTDDAAGLVDRLSRHASRLVRIERADAPPSTPAASGHERFLAAARAGDLDRALKALADMPSTAPLAQTYAAKLAARRTAREALDRVLQASAAPFRDASQRSAPSPR